MQWYCNVLARRPYLVTLAISVLCTACIIVSLSTNKLPNFTDPTLGFEARGTDIGKRLTAWHNLLQETGPSSSLVANPNDLHVEQRRHDAGLNEFQVLVPRNRNRRKRKRKNRRKQKTQHRKSKADITKKVFILKQRLRSSNITSSRDHDDGFTFALQQHIRSGSILDYESSTSNPNFTSDREDFAYGRNMTFVDEDDHRERVQTKKSTWRLLQQATVPSAAAGGDADDTISVSVDGYFCDSPAKEFSHFVVERIGPNATDSLFDLNGFLAMCELQYQITEVTSYEEYCQRDQLSNNCCRPWSLASYATLLANKSSCFDLNVEDVMALQILLVSCFEYFHDLKLSNDCSDLNPCYAPAECIRQNIVFNILHYITDYNFIKINDSNVFLKYAMIFVPVAHTTKILPLFHEWEKVDLSNEILEVIAMDLGLENELFNECLLTDAWLVALGGLFVMTCMWLYTTSIFVTVMTCIAVMFSLGLAYFIYTIVFEMSFFPYMNLLAVVVIIGIGADDAFIFMKIWQCVLSERFLKASSTTESRLSNEVAETTESLPNLMALTLHHAALSMFVTSLTTAGAFYASYTSYITAIKCFGIFAGTAVITNYILMVSWLPASISIMERMSTWGTCNKLHIQKLLLILNKSINRFGNILESTMTAAIINYSRYWCFLFGAVGVCCAVVVLYKPGLQLPQNTHFQLFVSKHPFEMYNSRLKNEFWFEKSKSNLENFKLPLRFVWGIEATDDGNYADPYALGNLYYDNNFNMSTKAAQMWLFEFCQNLRQQPFYEVTFGLLLPNCFIENFIAFMERMCVDGMDGTDRTPCCDVSKFPYEPHIFELCLPQSISSLYATPREYFMPGVAGPKFEVPFNPLKLSLVEATSNESTSTSRRDELATRPPLAKVLVIEFESNVSYSTVYEDIKLFVHTVEQWFQKELTRAPPEMRGGWFISDLKFFDVQDTLCSGTFVAISVAMIISLIVLLLVTSNVLISLYAVATVLLTIFVTVAILLLLGWRLNVLESITVSTAIGLAVDFSLHYGIHYRFSPTCERLAATQFSLSRIMGPTAMAAVTTGIAGAFMLFSNVLPYIQIGIFLVVVMTVSWIYSTFFLISLLRLAGPQHGFMQFNYPHLNKRPIVNGMKYYDRKQCNVVANEQLLTPSSSAIGELINSETHELDSLTSGSLVKTISGMECPSIDCEQIFQHNSHHIMVEAAATPAGSNTTDNVALGSASLTDDYPSPSFTAESSNILADGTVAVENAKFRSKTKSA